MRIAADGHAWPAAWNWLSFARREGTGDKTDFSSKTPCAKEYSMAIKVGDKLPEATFMTMSPEGPKPMTTAEVFGGKKVALFAVPGAYTPTCHKTHMPGFVERAAELKKKGFDTIACTAVNDIFVLTQWGKDSKADGKILMLADGSADFAKKIGLEIDLGGRGLGTRSRRYSMAIDNGVVKTLNIEEAPGSVDKSSAETLCSMVDSAPL
jgi:peroxiredoxin